MVNEIMSTLFDPNRKIWVLIEKGWGFGSGDILDEKGQKIGSMHRVIVSLGGKIELKELDESIACEVHKKIVAIRQTYDVKDPSGAMLGRIKKAMMAVIKPKLWLETEDDQKLYEARGKPMRWDFVILDASGKEIAKVNKLDKWKDVFIKGLFNFKDKYALRINDDAVGKVDARQLLGFVIAIDNIFHD